MIRHCRCLCSCYAYTTRDGMCRLCLREGHAKRFGVRVKPKKLLH